MAFQAQQLRAGAAAAALAVVAGGCTPGGLSGDPTALPPFASAPKRTVFDGSSDDLLTAGLGRSGLGASTAPAAANPTAPTDAELRRLAIYNNYRALVTMSPRGGYGVLFGPNIDPDGRDTLGEGKIAGVEYLAYADDGSGTKNVTMLVQIPANWNRERPCIVAAPSSGSRGPYGAIGTAGEWGLKRGCAIAYTDKGSGLGVHDLASDTVNLIQGSRVSAAIAGKASNFTSLGGAALASFNAAHPNRVAAKHAHSQQNPEKDWGRDTLNAIRFAFYALNQEAAGASAGAARRLYTPGNTIVIASSVSNGGGASLAAAEQDSEGLIDGVAVAEPQVSLMANAALRIARGSRTFSGSGRPLYDYFTLANLLQPCATLSPRAAGSPGANFVPAANATNRCASLRAKGILSKATTPEQADEALDMLIEAGWEPTSNRLHASHYPFGVAPTVVAYASAYGRYGVGDNLCGYSYAGVDANGRPAPVAAPALAQVFGTGGGIAPMAGVQIINDNNPGGAMRDAISSSPSTGVADLNVDGALCHRRLWTGSDAAATRVKAGVDEVRLAGNLRGKPAIIVHGREDSQVPAAFSSRPYFGVNRIVEGGRSRLTYIEVTNAQHFEAFIDSAAFPGYDAMFVPLHVYFIQAMDMMYAHLTAGAPLPPSQVVHTTPRGGTPGSAPQITAANVPPIAQSPAAANQITFSGTTLTIPD